MSTLEDFFKPLASDGPNDDDFCLYASTKEPDEEPVQMHVDRVDGFTGTLTPSTNADEAEITRRVLDPDSAIERAVDEVLRSKAVTLQAMRGAKAYGAKQFPYLFMTCEEVCKELVNRRIFEASGLTAKRVTSVWTGPVTLEFKSAYICDETMTHTVIALSLRDDFCVENSTEFKTKPDGVVLFDPTYVQFVGGPVSLTECMCDDIQTLSCGF